MVMVHPQPAYKNNWLIYTLAFFTAWPVYGRIWYQLCKIVTIAQWVHIHFPLNRVVRGFAIHFFKEFSYILRVFSCLTLRQEKLPVYKHCPIILNVKYFNLNFFRQFYLGYPLARKHTLSYQTIILPVVLYGCET